MGYFESASRNLGKIVYTIFDIENVTDNRLAEQYYEHARLELSSDDIVATLNVVKQVSGYVNRLLTGMRLSNKMNTTPCFENLVASTDKVLDGIKLLQEQ